MLFQVSRSLSVSCRPTDAGGVQRERGAALFAA
jgi:hypothetical protein